MSLLGSPPLPPEIKMSVNSVTQPELHQKIVEESVVEDMKAPEPQINKIVVLFTKELETADLEKFRRHGKAVFFNDSYINVPLSRVDADFVFVDANNETYLKSVDKEFNDESNGIEFCAYCRIWEKEHFEGINAFTTVKDAVDKDSFQWLLLNKRSLKKPNSLLSCMYFLVGFVSSLKKQ